MSDHPTIHGDDAIARELLTGISRLATALRSHAWRDSRARKLTPTQSHILQLLAGNGAAMRLNQVARALGVSAATASDAVSTLVAKGLVDKQRGTSDVRSIAISLTEAGELQARLSAEWPPSFTAAVHALSREEQSGFLKGTVRLLAALQEHGHISAARVCPGCKFFQSHAAQDDASRPHYCASLSLAIGDHELRTDCGRHEPLHTAGVKQSWEQTAENTRDDAVEAKVLS